MYSPFPTVAGAVQEELERYQQSENEIKRLKTAMVCHLTSFVSNLILI